MKYIPALDVVRAFAIILVFFFHTTYGRLPGGGIGVDVFFVLSGYLITNILRNEWIATGDISFRKFYYRRILRLVPALLIGILLANLLWNNVRMSPEANRLISNLSALFYFTNLVPGFVTNTFSHMWSLAVEEQFYLVWPAIMLWMRFNLKKMIGLLIAVSIIYFIPKPVFYSENFIIGESFLLFKAQGLMVGAILAVKMPNINGKLALICGFTAIITMVFFPGHAFLINTAAALLLVGAIKTDSILWTNKTLIWIGKRSYGLYLFHFPISQYLEGWRTLHSPLNFALVMLCKIGFTVLLAHVSYEWIEKYFLKLKNKMHTAKLELKPVAA